MTEARGKSGNLAIGSDHKSKKCFSLSHVLEYSSHRTVDSYDAPTIRLLIVKHISTCPQ